MRRDKGFTLIELLIVVAIIGIIAAIAIPNLLNAINRGKQKRTMADMRSIATAVESYSVDWNFYPKVAGGDSSSASTQLSTYLQPTYIKKIPANDGWNNPIHWLGDGTNGLNYTLFSNGKDNSKQGTWTNAGTTDFNADIVFVDGQFYQWPEGMQTN